ncbi:MAG: TonB-dependent receptor, partial [Nitrosomonas sp.]|nr:TonB-dependent receptor [Nitrosomonas sp.]
YHTNFLFFISSWENKAISTINCDIALIFDQRYILGSNFDFMFNGTWMNAKIEKGSVVAFTDSTGNPANFNQTGLQRIRMPHWRANFFTTYHATPAWDISFSGRYTNDSCNDPDNKDFVNDVFGTQSDFFFLDFKTSYRYQFASGIKSRFSFGISNINNDKAFVFHPYPQRTYLVEAAFSY